MIQNCLKIIFVFLAVYLFLQNFSPTSAQELSFEDLIKEQNSLILSDFIENKDLKTSGVEIPVKASWYGPGFDGRYTASGEIFNQSFFTAAHKSLPFGSLLIVTNPKNDKQVIVKVNDRGPFVQGRDIDLSKAAAAELGVLKKGISSLKYKLIKTE
jgi:rare lipoprotein A (peptidoglycan hydrolase)